MENVVIPIALAVLALICLFLFVYPYLVYPAILKSLPAEPIEGEEKESISGGFALLFCAYNEAGSANEKLQNIAELVAENPGLEVLVYDDGSTDGCAEIYESRPDLVTVVRGPGRRGKAQGMKTLVGRTTRPFLVFTDANVLLEAGCIKALREHFRNEGVGGVCGHLVYEQRTGSATEVTGAGYWSLEEGIKAQESRTGNVMGGDGSIFAIRRELYPDFPNTVQDDFTVTMSVVFRGSRLIFAHDVVAHERLVTISADEYRRKVRIAARAYHTHLSMRRSLLDMQRKDRWKYSSHKILRWYGAPFLAAFTILTAAALLASSLPAFLVAAALGTLAVGSGRWSRKAASAMEAVLAVVATFHGVVLALRGRTFATWVPPTSR